MLLHLYYTQHTDRPTENYGDRDVFIKFNFLPEGMRKTIYAKHVHIRHLLDKYLHAVYLLTQQIYQVM